MKKLLLASAVVLSLAGCATPLTNYQPTVENISEPPLNQVTKVSLGEPMLIQGRMTQREALYFAVPQKMGAGRTIQSGYFPKQGESDTYIQYSISSDTGAGKITETLLNDPSQGLMIRKSDNALCAYTIYAMTVDCRQGIQYEKRNWAVASADNQQQTLLYNGKVGNKINIAYREFNSNMARPAFNNDVEYDLSESNQIGYKGALLEVIEATNQNITYKVIKNFNSN